jgi:outer membrane receptor protein involved in Fe transport
MQYTSERTDTVNFAAPSDGTTTLDLRLGVEGNAWGVYLFGDNLTDEDGAVDVYSSGVPGTGPATRLRPRTFGVNLRYSFD